MIGEIKKVGYDYYIATNNQGTLEVLPKIRWYRTLQIYFLNHLKERSIGYVRDFYMEYKI